MAHRGATGADTGEFLGCRRCERGFVDAFGIAAHQDNAVDFAVGDFLGQLCVYCFRILVDGIQGLFLPGNHTAVFIQSIELCGCVGGDVVHRPACADELHKANFNTGRACLSKDFPQQSLGIVATLHIQVAAAGTDDCYSFHVYNPSFFLPQRIRRRRSPLRAHFSVSAVGLFWPAHLL